MLPFGNGLQYHNSDFEMFTKMNFSTLCTIFVKFGPETPEFTLLTVALFVAIRQKSAYHTKYLRMSFTGLVGVLVGMIFQIFVWWSPKGRCYGNQLNMGDVRKRRMERIYSSLQHSTTDWLIVNLLSKGSVAINRLRGVQIS